MIFGGGGKIAVVTAREASMLTPSFESMPVLYSWKNEGAGIEDERADVATFGQM